MWVVTGHSHVEVDLATGRWLAFAPARNQLDVCAFLRLIGSVPVAGS